MTFILFIILLIIIIYCLANYIDYYSDYKVDTNNLPYVNNNSYGHVYFGSGIPLYTEDIPRPMVYVNRPMNVQDLNKTDECKTMYSTTGSCMTDFPLTKFQ